MRIGLVSYECRNSDAAFNLSQIERALKETEGKTDLLCFGEAFLQGFDCLSWEYGADRDTALESSSGEIARLAGLTVRYGTALAVGYIERDGDSLYSSFIVLSEGKTVRNYRRISKGWKEFSRTDDHYREGSDTASFRIFGRDVKTALCGDLWDHPERFVSEDLLLWPVYVDFSTEEWNGGMLDEYAEQAAKASRVTLMVNPLSSETGNHGGSFLFRDGRTVQRIPFDEEGILIAEV